MNQLIQEYSKHEILSSVLVQDKEQKQQEMNCLIQENKHIQKV
jgi:hypothetical protein